MCERNRARQQLQQAASAVNGGSAVVQNTLPSLPTNPGSASTSAAAVQQSTAVNGGNLAAVNLINCQQQQTAGKQFKCPFCEKSYSWKQTLKQVKKTFIFITYFNTLLWGGGGENLLLFHFLNITAFQ